ncbi:hypothetical protein Tco_1107500 [Tanacetum coccineum]
MSVSVWPKAFTLDMPTSFGDIPSLTEETKRKGCTNTRFFSSLQIMHKDEGKHGLMIVTLFPTQISSVNNWALKPNQPEEPPFTTHMLAICALDKLVVFKAPKTSSRAESVSQGAKPEAKTRHKKPATSSKQPSVSSKEAIKGGSSKAPTSSKTGHSKRRKESRSAMDSNPSRPLVSTPVDTEMHKEDQQATGGPTSLGVTRHDVSVDFTAEADSGLSTPNDSIRIDPHVLANQTKSVSEGLETVLTQPTTEKGASSTAIHGDKEEASNTIKLEDLANLVSQIQPSFKDLDSPKDDLVIIVDESDEDKPNAETEDTSVLRSSSPRSSQIQELTNQVLILQSQKHKLKLEKNKAKAKAALLKAQPSFPNVEQLNELLVKSLQTEIMTLAAHCELRAKRNSHKAGRLYTATSLTSQVNFQKNVFPFQQSFPEVLKSTSTKAEDQSVPSAGQADTMPAEGEKDTNQETISQLF